MHIAFLHYRVPGQDWLQNHTRQIKRITCLITGIDSPVIKDSSAIEDPSMTQPSTGILLPGITYNASSD